MAKALLTLDTFKGVNTNAPGGITPAPNLLQNVNLDRTGGWSSMWARSPRVSDVTRALASGVGDDLFIEQAGTVRYWNPSTGSFTTLSGVTSLADTTRLMPGVLLAGGGAQWVTTTQAQAGALTPGTVSDTGTPDLLWSYTERPDPGTEVASQPPSFLGSAEYEFAIEWVPTPTRPLRGVTTFKVGAGHGTPPVRFWLHLLASSAYPQPSHYNVYYRSGTRPFMFLGSNYANVATTRPGTTTTTTGSAKSYYTELDVTPAPPDSTTEQLTGIGLSFSSGSDTATAYHRGRVYISPNSLTYQRVNTTFAEAKVEAVTTVVDAVPQRVYYSEVTADGRTNLPEFSLVNYFDVPLRVSRRIVAMQSVGPYLYIWGDRELWVMTGDPAYDANLECLGDSIGAVSAQSVRQLSGTVYWQSDSGVLAVNGAQVQEVGEAVRDQLTTLGLDVTATVDFRREGYIITDGVTILVYHAREQGWTTRQVESGSSPALVYGGGTPYMLQGGTLYSIGGEAGQTGTPARLPMTVRYPALELGSWTTLKSFERILFGVDLATMTASVTNDSTVDGLLSGEADTAQTVNPGRDGLCMLHMARDGINMTGGSIAVEFSVSTQDSRGIIRPPLVLTGDVSGDREFTDYAR